MYFVSMSMVVNILIMIGMFVVMEFFYIRIMVVFMSRLITGVTMVMIVFKRMFMAMPVMMSVTVLLVSMFVSMIMIMFMFVGVVMFMAVFSCCHGRIPP